MSDLADKIQEAAENAPESRLNACVALMVALVATFMALCNVKDGNICQAMQAAQTKAVDQWSYYQAKSTKQLIAENSAEMLRLQAETGPGLTPESKALLGKQADQFEARAKKYAQEKEEIKAEAQGEEKLYEDLNQHDDQFDMADAALSVGIALAGVSALAKKKWLFGLACGFSVFGLVLGFAGFLNWNLHPDWLARLLS